MASTNVFVGSLPPHVDDAALRRYFTPYGSITSVKVLKDASGMSRGLGFVQYANPKAAAGAITAMNGANVEGGVLVVKHAARNAGEKTAPRAAGALRFPLGATRGPAAPALPTDNIFVGNLPLTWTEGDLITLFSSCGPVVSAVVLADKATRRGKGAGLVRFADVGSASLAVQTLNGYAVEGKFLDVKFQERPEDKMGRKSARFSPYGRPGDRVPQKVLIPKRNDIEPEEGANLHVFGLDNQVTNEHLFRAFAGYGAIRGVQVMKDLATKKSKGFGFVQFFSAHDAHAAMTALNGLQVAGRPWSITVHQKK